MARFFDEISQVWVSVIPLNETCDQYVDDNGAAVRLVPRRLPLPSDRVETIRMKPNVMYPVNIEPLGIRGPLAEFALSMEKKLRKNDHKTGWGKLPVEALMRQLLLEIEEYKVAAEFLTVEEARDELVDVANFAMIMWDRLSTLDQKGLVNEGPSKS